MDKLMDMAFSLAPILILGSYGYTFLVTRNTAKPSDVADLKKDVQAVQARVDDIYKMLLQKRGDSRRGDIR